MLGKVTHLYLDYNSISLIQVSLKMLCKNNLSVKIYNKIEFKGAGVGGSKSSFLLFLIKVSVSYQMLFTRSKKCSQPRSSHFEIMKIPVITVCTQTLILICRKSIFSYICFPTILKFNLVFLRVKIQKKSVPSSILNEAFIKFFNDLLKPKLDFGSLSSSYQYF